MFIFKKQLYPTHYHTVLYDNVFIFVFFRKIYAFDFDLETGALKNKRVAIDVLPEFGVSIGNNTKLLYQQPCTQGFTSAPRPRR